MVFDFLEFFGGFFWYLANISVLVALFINVLIGEEFFIFSAFLFFNEILGIKVLYMARDSIDYLITLNYFLLVYLFEKVCMIYLGVISSLFYFLRDFRVKVIGGLKKSYFFCFSGMQWFSKFRNY